MLSVFIKGIVIGFSIGAVVGPIGVLCIRRTLAEGFFIGLMTGIGAALADALYGSIAAFGLSAVSDMLLQYVHIFQVLGGSYLIYLGYNTYMTQPTSTTVKTKTSSWLSAITQTFFLTMTNPVTILAFAALFTSFGVFTIATDHISASILTIGVFLGSCLWWILLSSISSILRAKLTPKTMVYINRISGIIIATFGFVTLIRVIR